MELGSSIKGADPSAADIYRICGVYCDRYQHCWLALFRGTA
ncbi:hypothetical protein [Leptolyngbya iicbica]|nr:hypothetical protein [Leptolyngbya sp. LK]